MLCRLMRMRAQWVFVSGNQCSPPQAPAKGSFTPQKNAYDIGDTVVFTCSGDYMSQGAEALTCTETGWSDKEPVCVSESAFLFVSSFFQNKLYQYFISLFGGVDWHIFQVEIAYIFLRSTHVCRLDSSGQWVSRSCAESVRSQSSGDLYL